MGRVFLAWDQTRARHVALKLLRPDRSGLLRRLKREFRSLSDIAHPGLCALYELHDQDGVLFLSMEYIEGDGFLDWCRRGLAQQNETKTPDAAHTWAGHADSVTMDEPPPADVASSSQTLDFGADGTVWEAALPGNSDRDAGREAPDPRRVRAALLQLTRAIEALHAAGRIHRDLKPGNVVVDHDDRVVVLDFGLVKGEDLPRHPSLGGPGPVEGTPAYMAPERLTRTGDGPEADWFSVGVMLFEVLVGWRPFHSYAQIRHLQPEDLMNPQLLAEGVPDDLAQLTLGLLHPDPTRRADGGTIREALGALQADAPPPLFSAHRFVGRADALQTLRDALDGADGGRDVIVQIVGRSGYGKSALLRAFLDETYAQRPELQVLSGRCYERENVPFRMFDGIVERIADILSHLKGQDVSAARLASVTPLFPSITTASSVPSLLSETSGLPLRDHAFAAQDLAAAIAALAGLMVEIASEQTLLVVIDDVQWGDLDSLRLLEMLLATPDRPQLLLLLASRAELADDPVVRGLERVVEGHVAATESLSSVDAARRGAWLRRVDIGPLDAAATAELLRAVPGAESIPVAPLIAETEGSPLLLHELAILRGAGLLQEGEGLPEAIQVRLGALPADARALFETICVAGHPLTQQDAWRAAKAGSAREEAIHLLRAAGLVRTHGGSPADPIEPAHDRVREMVVAQLAADDRRAAHGRLAGALDANPDVDAAIRAAHWRDGGNPKQAVALAREAARRAERAGAWVRLFEMLSMVEELSDLPPDRRTRLHLRQAHALRSAGRCQASARAFLEVSASLDAAASLDARLDAVEQLLIGGFHDEGLAQARQLLSEVGMSIPAGRLGLVASLGLERLRVGLNNPFVTPRPDATVAPRARARLKACWSMATGLSIVDSRLAAVFTARYLRLALHSGRPEAIAQGLALEAGHQASSGDGAAADALITRARAIAEGCDDPALEPFLDLLTGFVRYFQGRWPDAVAAYDAALDGYTQSRVGASWGESTAQIFGIWALLYAGEWRELQRRAVRMQRERWGGENRYHAHGAAIGAGVVAALMDDRPEDAARCIGVAMEGWEDREFGIQHFLHLYMSGWVDLYAGRPEVAWERVRGQWSALSGSLLLQVADVRHRMHHIRGYCGVAIGTAPARADARASAKVVRKIGTPGTVGVASVIAAAVAWQEGQGDAAEAHLEDAIQDFTDGLMPPYAAAARWRLAAIRGDRDAIRASADRLAALGCVRPDTWLAVLAPGLPAEPGA